MSIAIATHGRYSDPTEGATIIGVDLTVSVEVVDDIPLTGRGKLKLLERASEL